MRILGNLSPAALKEKLSQYRRTIAIARKPDKQEWTETARVSAAGIAIIGAVGFAVFIAYHLIIFMLGGAA